MVSGKQGQTRRHAHRTWQDAYGGLTRRALNMSAVRPMYGYWWISDCEGDGDVVGVVTPLVRGGVQVLHGDQVVELNGQLEVQEREEEEEEEDGEGQIEVEGEDVEIKERRTCTWMT